MEAVILSQGVRSTRIGFGCAGLMREPSATARREVLETAFDQGIRHFDVARMYGLGAAEAELGRFGEGRRDEIVIATKFGIEPARAAGRLAALQGPARSALARYPRLRSHVKRRSGALHQPHRYDVATARRSLETSLRELQTDYVDILFLHGPMPGDEVDLPEICAFLEGARDAGQLRSWGVAGDAGHCSDIHRALPGGAVLQVRYDILTASDSVALGGSAGPLITFGVLSDALGAILDRASGHNPGWLERLGVVDDDPESLARLLLAEALTMNADGVVLVSTTKAHRLVGIEDALSSVQNDARTLSRLRELVEADFSTSSSCV
jgi:D-threo-aldose 1-dehydrogenase